MTHAHPDPEPSTSPSLLERARRGDVDGWRRLAKLYGPIVYAWARRSGFQSADAADVMQETFSAVAKALPAFDAERSGATFRGWLWTITRNKLRDHVRQQVDRGAGGTEAQMQMQEMAQHDQTLESPEPPSTPDSDSAAIRRRTIEMLRTQVDPRTWRMFWETSIEERDPGEVAEDLGVSRWAVYKARARVLQRLRHELEGLE